jgi:hypothetical protein
MDVDHHALAVDIGDFDMAGLIETQATGINSGEKDVVGGSFDLSQKVLTSSTLKTAGRRCSF